MVCQRAGSSDALQQSNCLEQIALERPWTSHGYEEPSHAVPPMAATASALAAPPTPPAPPAPVPPVSTSQQRIQVNPSRLCGLLERLSSIDGFAALGASIDDAHDDDWVEQLCEQIGPSQFGVLRLPPTYANVYRRLIEPSCYPPAVFSETCKPRTREESLAQRLPISALPLPLVCDAAVWSAVCECICASVARELLERMRRGSRGAPAPPPVPPPPVPPPCCAVEHSCRGLLRVTVNSSAGPHLDNSYTTMTGAGNVRGTLQFEVPPQQHGPSLQPGQGAAGQGAAEEEEQTVEHEARFAPCEEFVAEEGAASTAFFIFCGVKMGGATSAWCRPLMHQVPVAPPAAPAVAPPAAEDAGSAAEDGSAARLAERQQHRVNVIYFLRNYCWSLRGSAPLVPCHVDCSGAQCEAREALWQSEASLEINAAGQRCILSQPKLTEWPRPADGCSSSMEHDAEHEEEAAEQRSAWEMVRDGELEFDWEGGLDAFV
jgi:hypothetical protein